MAKLRTAPGMWERAPGSWELIVEAGRDPVSGRRRQVSRMFTGNLREAKKARAELIVEVGNRHTGTAASVDHLYAEWIVELRRKGRSPNTVDGYERVYERNIRPTLGNIAMTKVNTKLLTDLYGAHQARGLSARSVYQIHACLSSMFTQDCRWGWRDTNPALWAEPPSLPNTTPVVPTPGDVRKLIDAAEQSKRPEYARAILVAATTGIRRAELCAVRRERDVDWERGLLSITASIVVLKDVPLQEIPTKNRRGRTIALDGLTLSMLQAQVEMQQRRAAMARVELLPDACVFSDDIEGAVPWNPDAVSQYFGRLRRGARLPHIDFHYLRKFMETYGQEMGYSVSQVAMRARIAALSARSASAPCITASRSTATASG